MRLATNETDSRKASVPSSASCFHRCSSYGRNSQPPGAVLESDQQYDFGVPIGAGRQLELGPDQCKNDKDAGVEPDERLPITGITPAHYDAKLSDVRGRICVVRDIKIEPGAVFVIEEKDLTSCGH